MFSRSMWWLRLIYQCMCRVEGGLRVGVEAGARVPGVMEACVTLLLTPPGPMHLGAVGSAPLESTTLALAALSPHLLHTLIMTLLTHPLLRQPAGNVPSQFKEKCDVREGSRSSPGAEACQVLATGRERRQNTSLKML